jgi:ribosomal protein S18 acetylase RimI-like enzyme
MAVMALTISSTHRTLALEEKRQLADTLGDNPETALAVHLLRKGNGQIHLVGELTNFRAVVIEDYSVGPQLLGFGDDVSGFCRILQGLDGWDEVNVPKIIAPELSRVILEEMHLPHQLVDDIYQVPAGPVPFFPSNDVRMLTREDISLLKATPDDILDSFDDDLEAVLQEELIAGAVLPGQIVAIASTYGYQEKFVDVAISTLPEFRGRGYARAAASLVAARVQEAGRTPIWSCAPTNTSSLHVASRLGFHEVSRRVNIVLDAEQA